MKYFFSTLTGLIIGTGCILLFLYLTFVIFPLPSEIDFKNLDSIRENMEIIPDINFAMIVVSYGIASFLAGFTSAKIRTFNPMIPLIIIGVTLTLIGFINFIAVLLPLWVVVIGSFTFFPFTRLGGKLGSEGYV